MKLSGQLLCYIFKLQFGIERMKKYKILFCALSGCFLTGCASIVSGDNQPISIVTIHEGESVSGASCTIKNDEGTWFVESPGSTTVSRSGETLTVVCEKDGYESGIATVESTTKPMAFGNIIFGGIVGAAVDAGTGAAFDYPASIQVIMGTETTIK